MKYLNNEKIYYAFIAGANKVINYRSLLNKINVFPVADSDTGNNLAATMNSIISDSKKKDSIKKTLESIAEAALLGAKGNSGIIFAQFLNGFSEELEADDEVSIDKFANSVNKAVPYAYNSIAEPVEGTMITVINEWALAVDDLKSNANDFLDLFHQSLIEAKGSLENTTEQLDVLKKSGVVDAGGQGFVKFIEGILEFFQEGSINDEVAATTEELDFVREEIPSNFTSEYRYCTEALLTSTTSSETDFKEVVASLGDSLIVAQTKQRTKVHIHTDHPAEVFANLRDYGQITKQKVDDMYRQYVVANERKHEIALVTDSIADLPEQIIENHQIHIINLNLIIAGTSYLDKLTITPNKFYSLLEEVEEYPTSSQPNLKQVQDLFSFLSDHYKSIIAITVSKELSGTWNVVQRAADNLKQTGEEITVINSKLNSGAQGLLTLEAAEKIEAGYDHGQVVEEVLALRNRAEIYVSVDQLQYMIRGGRIGSVQGFFAKLLNLKPIIALDETGAGVAFGKSFSQRGVKKKIKKAVEEIKQEQGVKRYAIVHANAEKKADEYQKLFVALLGQEAEYITEISPIIALNAGVGSVAIALISNNTD
jgi:DegV family protein with EDD domain